MSEFVPILSALPERLGFPAFFAREIPELPRDRYLHILVLRETRGYALFTTETGEEQTVESVPYSLRDPKPVDRLVVFKRKAVAAERRRGRALLRGYGGFPIVIEQGRVLVGAETEGVSAEPRRAGRRGRGQGNQPTRYDRCYHPENCGVCADCLLYGFAATDQSQGNQRSRVLTDSLFSVMPYALLSRRLTFNYIDERAQTSGTVTEYDYTRPGIVFPSVVSLADPTPEEAAFVLGTLLRTSRYGKEQSRQGWMRNHVVALAFADTELFSNLEWTLAYTDVFQEAGLGLDKVHLQHFCQYAMASLRLLTPEMAGVVRWVWRKAMLGPDGGDRWEDGEAANTGAADHAAADPTEKGGEGVEKTDRKDQLVLDDVLAEIQALYTDPSRLTRFVQHLNRQAAAAAWRRRSQQQEEAADVGEAEGE